MTYVRKSVWANGGDFRDPLLYWYAKGVAALKAKPLNDKTSWRFMAAIHGIDFNLWQQYGYYNPGEPLPAQAIQDKYWNQCQHQSWYFLPWHRGYVWSIESLLRQAIISLNGPSDWAMPYWDYSDTVQSNARMLPPAFAQKTLNDGAANPLYVAQRYGMGVTPIVLPAGDVTLGALKIDYFTGKSALTPGFGGLKTGFSHGGNVSGALESKPHNIVHVDVGGQNSVGPGLMSDPDTAGLDPIFWLHHANIDRLWQVWNTMSSKHVDPTDAAWLNGPLNRTFVVPTTTGGDFPYSPKDVLQTTQAPLDYVYDAGTTAISRPFIAMTSGGPMSDRKEPELIGANAGTLSIAGAHTRSTVQMNQRLAGAVSNSVKGVATRAMSATAIEGAHTVGHDDILLSLEQIRSARDGGVLDVYLNLPDGAKPEDHQDLFAGSVALFGARNASKSDGAHGGMGLSKVLDITQVVARLSLGDTFDLGSMKVDLIARQASPADDKITVDRISVYRHEQ